MGRPGVGKPGVVVKSSWGRRLCGLSGSVGEWDGGFCFFGLVFFFRRAVLAWAVGGVVVSVVVVAVAGLLY